MATQANAVVFGCVALMVCGLGICGAALRSRPSAPSTSPASASAAPPSMPFIAAPIVYPEFDVAKKNRQIGWCRAHHGVPTMTFDYEGSNVLCLKPEAVIELPREGGGK
jgi:hypothetical protein